jgi:hypothetical protein
MKTSRIIILILTFVALVLTIHTRLRRRNPSQALQFRSMIGRPKPRSREQWKR